MHTDEHGSSSRSEDEDSDRLSPAWLMAGSALFVATLAAPVAVVHLGTRPEVIVAETVSEDSSKPVFSVTRETKPEQEMLPLTERLASGPIVPGVQIGDLKLGTDAERLVRAIDDPMSVSFAVGPEGLFQRYEYALDDIRLTVQADPDIGQIDALRIAAVNCDAVRTFQPRQEGLPSTTDGLTIGSHVSRVVKRLGQADTGGTTEAAPSLPNEHIEQRYPGLQIRYCPEDMLVGAISVVRLPDAPVDRVPLVARVAPGEMAHPTATRDTELALAIVETAAPSAAMAGTAVGQNHTNHAAITPGLDALLAGGKIAEAVTTGAPELAVPLEDGAPRVASMHDTLPAEVLVSSRFTEAMLPTQTPDAASVPALVAEVPLPGISTPAPLLALEGGAYAVSDAFYNSAVPDKDLVVVRQAPDATPALTLLASGAPAPDFSGLATEEALALTRRARREIQIRMSLVEFDPKGADGIFGPNTREAISDLQSAWNIPATGYLDEQTVTSLKARTQRSYRRWASLQRAKQERRRKSTKLAPVVTARLPAARNAPQCARDGKGQIIENQSFNCDGKLLGESLSALFSGRAFDIDLSG